MQESMVGLGWEGFLAVEKYGEIKLQIVFLEQTRFKSLLSPPLLMANDDIFTMQICIMERYVLGFI